MAQKTQTREAVAKTFLISNRFASLRRLSHSSRKPRFKSFDSTLASLTAPIPQEQINASRKKHQIIIASLEFWATTATLRYKMYISAITEISVCLVRVTLFTI